jgi:hypothetical protein
MEGEVTNIFLVTGKMKEFFGKLSFWFRKSEGRNLGTFPFLKDFVEEKKLEANGTRIDQCINNLLVHLQTSIF